MSDWSTEPRPHEVVGPIDVTPTLPAVIRRAVRLFGEATFLIEGARRVSFADADRQSAELAKGLLAAGLGKGSRVGLMMPNGVDWVLAWFAVARIGAVPVALSTMFKRREIDWALRHNDLDTLLMSARFEATDYQALLEDAAPDLATADAGRPIALAAHPYLRRVMVWGADALRPWAADGPQTLAKLARERPAFDDALLAAVEAQITPADDLIVICTSGTTAEPKAVVHTHGGALRNTWNFTPYTLLQRNERMFCGLPFFWVGGLLRGLMPALYTGGCLCFPDGRDGDAMLDMLLRDEVTIVYTGAGPNREIRLAAARRGVDLNFIRDGVGPFIERGTGERLPPLARGNSLGMTETFGTHSSEAQDLRTPPGKDLTFGRPMPDVERRIVDLETGEPQPPGREGELQVRGPMLMRGYYKRERSEAFTPDGFFRTGDRCVIDADDFLYFFGRTSEMIKASGANVAPMEVEAALRVQPGVRDAIVFGIHPGTGAESVAAVVVPEDGAALDVEALGAALKREISSYKVPKVMVVMAEADIPRTDAVGKPKKAQLRELVEAMRP